MNPKQFLPASTIAGKILHEKLGPESFIRDWDFRSYFEMLGKDFPDTVVLFDKLLNISRGKPCENPKELCAEIRARVEAQAVMCRHMAEQAKGYGSKYFGKDVFDRTCKLLSDFYNNTQLPNPKLDAMALLIENNRELYDLVSNYFRDHTAAEALQTKILPLLDDLEEALTKQQGSSIGVGKG
jgi:hypothetical protein